MDQILRYKDGKLLDDERNRYSKTAIMARRAEHLEKSMEKLKKQNQELLPHHQHPHLVRLREMGDVPIHKDLPFHPEIEKISEPSEYDTQADIEERQRLQLFAEHWDNKTTIESNRIFSTWANNPNPTEEEYLEMNETLGQNPTQQETDDIVKSIMRKRLQIMLEQEKERIKNEFFENKQNKLPLPGMSYHLEKRMITEYEDLVDDIVYG